MNSGDKNDKICSDITLKIPTNGDFQIFFNMTNVTADVQMHRPAMRIYRLPNTSISPLATSCNFKVMVLIIEATTDR